MQLDMFLEHELFGDKNFREADPQTRLIMGFYRAEREIHNFAYNPNSHKQERAVYVAGRLVTLVQDFGEAFKTFPGRTIHGRYFMGKPAA